MSNDQLLLRQVGEFFYGGEWQAPLARDLRVNERTMRRWIGGTEQVPRGVWRDLSKRMDTYDQMFGLLRAEVKRSSGLVQVHSFRAWDSRAGDMVQPPQKSTAERIARIGGEIVPDTGEWVDPSAIDADGRMKAASSTRMPKQRKTAKELADLIAERIGVGGVFVMVHKDPVYGWHPTVATAPSAAYKCQIMAERIADELRLMYELSE